MEEAPAIVYTKKANNMDMVKSKDGIKIHTLSKGSGQPLLFLNGLRSTLGCWKRQVNEFSSKYQCVCYDHRGVGKSDKPSKAYTSQQHMDDINAVINHYSMKSPVLIGHSMGALRSLQYALANQDHIKGLVLINSGAHINMSLKLMMRTTLKAIENNNKELLDAMNEIGLAITFGEKSLSELEPRFDDFVDSSFAGVTLDSAKNLYAGMLQEKIDVRESLHELTIPTLVIAGDEDLQFPCKYAQEMSELIPNAEYKLLKGCGHFALSEKPNELNEMLVEFLGDIGK